MLDHRLARALRQGPEGAGVEVGRCAGGRECRAQAVDVDHAPDRRSSGGRVAKVASRLGGCSGADASPTSSSGSSTSSSARTPTPCAASPRRAGASCDADEEDATEAFGDYLDEVGWAAEELRDIRDGYAGTLDDAATSAYFGAYHKAVRRRFPELYDAYRHDEDLAGGVDEDD